ncbi:MAG: C39 family peptidase [Anaerolineaceae bacterium]|nr:C39 family peptidase [Anaerolineaceae bacterium]
MSKPPARSILACVSILVGGLIFSACGQSAAAIRSSSLITTQAPPQLIIQTLSATPPALASPIPTKYSPTAIETPSPAILSENNSLVIPTETVIPSEHYILKISGHHQYFAIGCETSAAVDWAAYFGVHINEFNFQYEMPLSDNPDYGFVGDVNGPWGQVPPYAYGVYAGPIAKILQKHGLPAKAIKSFTIGQIRSEIANDHPIIAWVIGNVVGGVPAVYTDSQGRNTVVAAYEHVVIVTGYNEKSIRYMNNGKFYETPIDNFQNSWKVLGNMVVYWSK